MDEDATWYGSRHRRRPHCISRVPSAPRKGHSTPAPSLGPRLLWPQSPISATAELLFYLLRLRRYKAKGVNSRCCQEGIGQFQPKFQGKGVVPGEYFFGFYKTRHILLSDSANCTVLRTVLLAQFRRVTDGRNCRS